VKITTIDDGFVARIYKTSAVVGGIGLLASWRIGGPFASMGWAAGAILSIILLRVIEYAVKSCFAKDVLKPREKFARIFIIKLPLMIVVLGLAVWVGKFNVAFVAAFCVGLALAQVVIILKVLGLLISERLAG